jgi:formylglycine-generating enzyme required for sulfatase activity
MGSPLDEPGRFEEETQHQVILTKTVYVSICEVTQSEWLAVMGWNESTFPGENRPVEQVTWYDAVSYCNERSAAEGLAAAYTITEPVYQWYHLMSATVAWNPAATGYRLLTEAEWEHACRAESATAFSNGGISDTSCTPVDPRLDQIGWYCGNAAGTTHDVGEKAANAWGLKEMHGNVWEWCWDYWEASYDGDAIDPTGPATGSDRVMRGGGWSADARRCRSAHRAGGNPDGLYSGLGLRVCRTAL